MKKLSKTLFHDLFEVPVFCALAILAIIGLGVTIALIYLQDWTGLKIFPTHDGSDRLLIGVGIISAGLGLFQSIIAAHYFYFGYVAAGFDILIYPTVLGVLFVFLHDLILTPKS